METKREEEVLQGTETSRSKTKPDNIVYPLGELGRGIFQSYFNSYMSMLMTSVYQFPILIAGFIESFMTVSGWIAQPLLGIFIDRFSFKKSKFWPWYIIAGAGAGVMYILVFCLPLLSDSPASLVFPVACLITLITICSSCISQVSLNIFASLSKDPVIRARLSSFAKVARDGMKIVVGFIFPIMLAAFTDIFGAEVKAWALTAVILAGIAIALFVVTAIACSKSEFEKAAMQAKALRQQNKNKKAKAKLSVVAKSIFGNRALLAVAFGFIAVKIFYFCHIMGGSYLWRYYFGNFTMMSAYNIVVNVAAIFGALSVPLCMKLVKDTKRLYIGSFIIQAIVYGISIFVVRSNAPIASIGILAVAFFFNGISDTLILPMFAVACDYGQWKYGVSEPGLTMSCYQLSLKIGSFVSLALRTALLAAGGFDSVALANGAAVPEGVLTALHGMNTILPMIVCIIIAIVVGVLYPISDKKMQQIRIDLQNRQ